MGNFKVLYEKPNLEDLNKKYTVVDMHFHTSYTDGINKVDSIIKHAKKHNIGIAITDHNDIRGAVEIDKCKSLLTIPGIEVTSKLGTHVIVYFYDIEDLKKFYEKTVKPNLGNDMMSSTSLKITEIMEAARKYPSVIVFPHPYAAGFVGICNHHIPKKELNEMLEKVDGIEVMNSENMHKWNLKCTVMGFNLNKGVVGGSDGHTLYHMAKVVTYADCKKDRKAFLDAIKQGKTNVIGKEIDILRKVTSNSFKLRSTLRNYPEVVEKNIKYGYAIFHSKAGRHIGHHLKKAIGLVKREKIRK